MLEGKRRLVVLVLTIAFAVCGYVYYRIEAARVGVVIAEQLLKPHALAGVDTQRWAQLKLGMTKEEVQNLLGEAPSKQNIEPSDKSKLSDQTFREFWEWGFTYGILAPVPHEKAFAVYFDQDGKVSSFQSPQTPK